MRRLLPLLLLALLVLLPPQADAALAVTSHGKVFSGTAGNGTWLKVTLPSWTFVAQVEVSGNAFCDGYGGGYTDGAARVSGGVPCAAGETRTYPISPESTSSAVYVSGDGASRTVYVTAYSAEGN